MCKACKMDPHETAIFRQRQGAVEISDFDDDELLRYRHPKRRVNKNKGLSKTPGCSGNDGKAHVYVWTTENSEEDFFFKFYGYHKEERHICAGCGKSKYGRRDTVRYARWKEREYRKRYGDQYDVPRGEPVSRSWRRRYKPSFSYFSPEKFDPQYCEAYKAYCIRLGLPAWYYSRY